MSMYLKTREPVANYTSDLERSPVRRARIIDQLATQAADDRL